MKDPVNFVRHDTLKSIIFFNYRFTFLNRESHFPMIFININK